MKWKRKIMPKIFSLSSRCWNIDFSSQHFHPTIFESVHVLVGKIHRTKKWEKFLFSCWNELTEATSQEDIFNNYFYIDIDFSMDWKQSCCPWLDFLVYISNDNIILFQANIYYRATLLGFTSHEPKISVLLFSSIFSLMRIQLRLYLLSGRWWIYLTFLLLNT